jgi:hypothetical protein
MEQTTNILTRQTEVRGEPVTIYSIDGCRWFSNPHEIELYQKRIAKELKSRRFKGLGRSNVTLKRF